MKGTAGAAFGRHAVLAALGLVMGSAGLNPVFAQSGPAPQNWMHPGGIIARWQLNVFHVSLAIVLTVAAVVSVLLIYTLWKFRDRSYRPGLERKADPAGLPPQIDGNHTLEIIWTVIPVILLVVLAVPTVRTNYLLASPPPSDPIPVRVIAYQWWWAFEYPEHGVVTANELRIPVGKPVQLTFESNDVIHKFWVPQLAGKMDVIPGRINQSWLQADREGVFYGQCAELCGPSHAHMRLRVIAQPEHEFEAWIASYGREPQPRSEAEAAAFHRGMEIFAARGCSACHTIEGTVFQGKVGPNLTGFGSRMTVGAGIMSNTRENLARWVTNPGALKPGVMMPAHDLSREEQDALVTFLHSL